MCVHKHVDRLLPPSPQGDVWHSLGAATAINLPVNEKSSVKQPDGTAWHAARHKHAHVHTYCTIHSQIDSHICTFTHTQSCLPRLYTSQLLLVTGPHHSLRQPLPLHFSPTLPLSCSPSYPSSLPPSRLWQLLIHVAALQMSQLTSWENSGGGKERRGFERKGGVCCVSIFDRETHLLDEDWVIHN